MARADLRPSRRRILHDYILVWVDPNLDESNSDYRQILEQLRTSVKDVTVFTEPNACVEFLEIVHKEKALVIISEELGQYLVPCIHSMAQVHTIYIISSNRELDEPWIREWSKIEDVYTTIESICEVLQQSVRQYNQDSTPMSFVQQDTVTSATNLDQLEPSFMYTQLFKDALLEMKHDEKERKDLVKFCREQKAGRLAELRVIDEFESQYTPDKAIWWYTRECFTYQMLNRALRLLEADTIVNMGFFIHDLHQQIEQLHREQVDQYHGNVLTLYRGQGLYMADFDKLKNMKGGLLSFNSFVSTTKDPDMARLLAKSSSLAVEKVGILFVMTIDPTQTSTPFADIVEQSYFGEEVEVLFSMHSVFRIDQVSDLDGDGRLFEVRLVLTADDDPQLRLLRESMAEEMEGSTGWDRIAQLLMKVGHLGKVEGIYDMLLEQGVGAEDEQVTYNHNVGRIKYAQGDYRRALMNCEKKSLDIEQKSLPADHPDLATSYNNLASVYYSMGEYSKALSYCEKCLDVQQKSLPAYHPSVATSYNNIGSVYDSMGEYSKALSYYEKCLDVQQKSLPAYHPSVATSYNNIGSVCKSMGEYSKALSYYEKCLDVRQKSLPAYHPSVAASYNNIGSVYNSMGEYSKALSYYEKCLDVQQKSLPAYHPSVATSYNNIGSVYNSMGGYSKALSYYEKCLDVEQKSLPAYHPSVATSYNNLASVYYSMGEYSKALSYCEKCLDVQQKSLPANHPSVATSYNNIGSVYDSMGEYSKALSYYEKCLDIQQKSLPADHPDLASSYNNIGSVYDSMAEYPKALLLS